MLNGAVFMVECVGAKIGSVFWPYLGTLRGRWDYAEYPDTKDANYRCARCNSVRNVTTIPGVCVVVNVAKRSITVTDPLNRADMRFAAGAAGKIFGCGFKTVPCVRLDDRPDDELKTVVWWARAMLDAGAVVQVNPRCVYGTCHTGATSTPCPGLFAWPRPKRSGLGNRSNREACHESRSGSGTDVAGPPAASLDNRCNDEGLRHHIATVRGE